MSDLADVVEALAARIRTGLAGDVLEGRTYAFAPDSIVPPTAIVLPSSDDFLDFDVTFDGQDDFGLVVKILMGTQDDRSGQAELLGYLSRSGSTSIRTAIYGDATLGGVVSDLKVTGARGYGDIEWAGQVFYGAELTVQAYA
jgi:hypothetical protein